MKGLTVVNTGDLVLEVDQSRELVDAVLLGFVGVVDLDESDALLVTFIVDMLQFGQDIFAFLFILVI